MGVFDYGIVDPSTVTKRIEAMIWDEAGAMSGPEVVALIQVAGIEDDMARRLMDRWYFLDEDASACWFEGRLYWISEPGLPRDLDRDPMEDPILATEIVASYSPAE